MGQSLNQKRLPAVRLFAHSRAICQRTCEVIVAKRKRPTYGVLGLADMGGRLGQLGCFSPPRTVSSKREPSARMM